MKIDLKTLQPKIDALLLEQDVKAIHHLVTKSGVFNATEIATATELAELKLRGLDDSYQFLFARNEGGVPIAYTCYGEIPLTDKSYDLYWIVVSPEYQAQGLAGRLLQETEARIIALGGMQIYAETSGIEAYAPAHAFYIKNGFKQVALLKGFYRKGDDKVIYCKPIESKLKE